MPKYRLEVTNKDEDAQEDDEVISPNGATEFGTKDYLDADLQAQRPEGPTYSKTNSWNQGQASGIYRFS